MAVQLPQDLNLNIIASFTQRRRGILYGFVVSVIAAPALTLLAFGILRIIPCTAPLFPTISKEIAYAMIGGGGIVISVIVIATSIIWRKRSQFVKKSDEVIELLKNPNSQVTQDITQNNDKFGMIPLECNGLWLVYHNKLNSENEESELHIFPNVEDQQEFLKDESAVKN